MRHSKRLQTSLAALVVAMSWVISMPAAAAVSVGETAPSFTLRSVLGNSVSLKDYAGRVVVLEWINPNCPFSRRHAREKTMIDLTQKYPRVAWLAINSTSEGHRDFLSPRDHAEYDRRMGIEYPVLYDSSGAIGKAYGAHTTPHMFVIDEHGTVIYAGAIDNDPSGSLDAGKRTNYVDAALGAHAHGESPDPSTTRPYGCSVKYGN